MKFRTMFLPKFRTMFRSKSALFVLLALVLVGWASTAMACPMCSQALGDESRGGDLISGFFWSIVFMMSMPFLIVATLGTYFYLSVKRARAAQQAVALSAASAMNRQKFTSDASEDHTADQELIEV